MNLGQILIIDDEQSLVLPLKRGLAHYGINADSCTNCEEAKHMSSIKKYDVVFVDLNLPDGNGLDLLEYLKKRSPQTYFIVLTGYGSVEVAVKSIQKGAYHFITKPFNLNEVINFSLNALDTKNTKQENTYLKKSLKSNTYKKLLGNSEPIQQVLSLVDRIAESNSNVLITGESGTGKELIAKAIHFNSERKNKPFVAINCGAIPAELLESELFGHTKGAFTGAAQARKGRFEIAEGGTLFFDEIGDMPVSLQVKLLRVLQERRFEPVGSSESKSCDVRILAATHRNLESQVSMGNFREDLFYRLNVIPIEIPALRERKDDIPLLINHFIEIHNQKRKVAINEITVDAMNMLINFSWPGNVRELENLIERLCILTSSSTIKAQDLPKKIQNASDSSFNPFEQKIPEAGIDFNTLVDNFENQLILKALEKTGWNKNQAAILLKLNRTTLVEKIKKKGLTKNEPEMSQ